MFDGDGPGSLLFNPLLHNTRHSVYHRVELQKSLRLTLSNDSSTLFRPSLGHGGGRYVQMGRLGENIAYNS
jgi:hypothetical protein